MILTALVLALGLTAAGCQTGIAGAASSRGPEPRAAVSQIQRTPGAYYANGTGHVSGFPGGPWDQAGQAIRGAAKRTGQGAEDTGKAVEKAVKDTGKTAKKAAKDTGKAVKKAAERTGEAAKQTAKDAGQAVRNAAGPTM